MFWRVASLATTSPVDLILERENYTLEDLLDEDDLIQECKSLNTNLINFLKKKEQLFKLVHYIIEDAESEEDKHLAFKYPFVACEIFACEIEGIFNAMLDDSEIIDLLFSFLDPEKPHPNLLAGYFSKVVICLFIRRTSEIMAYLQSHQDILVKLVNLVGITSIMEVLIKLVGADEQIMMYHIDALNWLPKTNLLEMLVERLGPQFSADEQANSAETLSAISKTAPSALFAQLSSPQYFSKLFELIVGSPQSRSGIVHSLSVCVTLLEPRKPMTYQGSGSFRNLSVLQSLPLPIDPDTIKGVLSKIGDLLSVLDTENDDSVILTTYGELKPPFGIHRIKILEFLAVLLRSHFSLSCPEFREKNVLRILIDLFFKFPFNNSVHHQVESVIDTCLQSADLPTIEHLLIDCDLVTLVLNADSNQYLTPGTTATVTRAPIRVGYLGHLTRIANKLDKLSQESEAIKTILDRNERWTTWVIDSLEKRNNIENVMNWKCGRPSRVGDRMDPEDDFSLGQSFDISSINLSNLRYPETDDTDADTMEIDKGMLELQLSSSKPLEQDSDIPSDLLGTSPEVPSTSASARAVSAGDLGLDGDQNPDSKVDEVDVQLTPTDTPAQVTDWSPFLSPVPLPHAPGTQQESPEISLGHSSLSVIQKYIDSAPNMLASSSQSPAEVPVETSHQGTLPFAPYGNHVPEAPKFVPEIADDDDFDVRGTSAFFEPPKGPQETAKVSPRGSQKSKNVGLSVSKPQSVVIGFGEVERVDTPRPLEDEPGDLEAVPETGPKASSDWASFRDSVSKIHAVSVDSGNGPVDEGVSQVEEVGTVAGDSGDQLLVNEAVKPAMVLNEVDDGAGEVKSGGEISEVNGES